LFGAEIDEVPNSLPISPVKDSVKISKVRDTDSRRAPVAVSLGPCLQQASMIRMAPTAKTALAGTLKRFATKPPKAQKEMIRGLKVFVRHWLETNLTPLPSSTDVTVETWLSKTNYPDWRKQELRKIYEEGKIRSDHNWTKVKSFIKDESYPDYKHARAINSRSDFAKCVFGPWSKVIESELFKLPMFIKKIPSTLRAQYILDTLYMEGSDYYATDYTSFEALFTAEIMEAVEFQLYEYMTKEIPGSSEFMRNCRRVIAGENTCVFKWFTLKILATRMSGEMFTSLGNGFSNWMFVSYICSRTNTSLKGLVEGDDGIFRFSGPVPTSDDFKKLGLNIKMEKHHDLCTASFCGNVFDIEAKDIVTNPVEALSDFGWTSSKYMFAKKSSHMALLRAKAWSTGYQYPAMPILSSLSRAMLRLTRSHNVTKVLNAKGAMNTWQRDQLLEAMDAGRPELNKTVHPNTRLLVERLYDVPVWLQLRYEDYFDNLEVIGEIPDFGLPIPNSWKDFSSKYKVDVDLSSPVLYDWVSGVPTRPVQWPMNIQFMSG